MARRPSLRSPKTRSTFRGSCRAPRHPCGGRPLRAYVGASFPRRQEADPVSVRSLCCAAVILLFAPLRSAPAQTYDSTVFAGLTWREIGIFRGGRSVAVAGSAARPNEYWFGSTGGGGFKSNDGVNIWHAVNDKYLTG